MLGVEKHNQAATLFSLAFFLSVTIVCCQIGLAFLDVNQPLV